MCAIRDDLSDGYPRRGVSQHVGWCDDTSLTVRALVSPVPLGGTKVPASAAFPSGLPEALEASVALRLASDISDSENGTFLLRSLTGITLTSHRQRLVVAMFL